MFSVSPWLIIPRSDKQVMHHGVTANTEEKSPDLLSYHTDILRIVQKLRVRLANWRRILLLPSNDLEQLIKKSIVGYD